MYALTEWYQSVIGFMNAGGIVLWWIAALTFWMWTMVFERIWYFRFGMKKDAALAIAAWEARNERRSWNARQIRQLLISESSLRIKQSLPLIKTLVALCPLLGLLGTVTGMIEVFNVMAITGGGEARAMAGGVSKATIPTMAGMVAALSGVFADTYLSRVADRESKLLEDHLTADH
jgi:biopolymer transport protein ExbB